ncbi:MAG: chorismate mutase, partial [Gammaproteobacteria bacterium]
MNTDKPDASAAEPDWPGADALPDTLEGVRARIDAIDDAILALLNRRAACALKVGEIKVGETKVGEAKVGEAKVGEAKQTAPGNDAPVFY